MASGVPKPFRIMRAKDGKTLWASIPVSLGKVRWQCPKDEAKVSQAISKVASGSAVVDPILAPDGNEFRVRSGEDVLEASSILGRPSAICWIPFGSYRKTLEPKPSEPAAVADAFVGVRSGGFRIVSGQEPLVGRRLILRRDLAGAMRDALGGDYAGDSVPESVIRENGRYGWILAVRLPKGWRPSVSPESVGEAIWRSDMHEILAAAQTRLHPILYSRVRMGNRAAWRTAGRVLLEQRSISRAGLRELSRMQESPVPEGAEVIGSWRLDRFLSPLLSLKGENLLSVAKRFSGSGESLSSPDGQETAVAVAVLDTSTGGSPKSAALMAVKEACEAALGKSWGFLGMRELPRPTFRWRMPSAATDPEKLVVRIAEACGKSQAFPVAVSVSGRQAGQGNWERKALFRTGGDDGDGG
jgi:hypothetical protein